MAKSTTTPAKPEITMTGEQVAELRAEGQTWKQIAEAAGLPDGASIIPLRNAMYTAVGKTVKARSKKDVGAAIVKMRDGGDGWPKVAAATGLSASEARAAYTEAGGTNPDGRVYVRQPAKEGEDATVTVRVESTQAGKTEGEGQGEADSAA